MISNAELDEVGRWLTQNPPLCADREARRAQLNRIQMATDEFPDSAYHEYMNTWAKQTEAAALERVGVLYYLAQRLARAVEEVRTAKVTRGLLAWHFYNMGYVFKTADACFGIDLHGRGLEGLAGNLDFLLLTHSHPDHWTPALLKELQTRGKPVVSNWCDFGTRLAGPQELLLGHTKIRVTLGDHNCNNPAQHNNMLLYEVQAGGAAIYHVGDNANLEKMKPTQPIDLYMFHVQVGLPVVESIRKVNARLALASHVLELGHSRFPPYAWRWSYDFAYECIQEFPAERAEVPAWGERYETPGTEWRFV